MIHRITLTTVLLFAALMSGAPAQAQVIFRMDYSAGAAPNAGWAAEPTSSLYQRTRIAGAGPAGQDVYELRQLSCLTCGSWGGQFNWGWRSSVEGNVALGSRRYYRWRMRFTPDTNFLSVSGGDGEVANLQNKLLIVGQGCNTGRCRFILTYRGDSSNQRVQYMRLQIDGGEDDVETGAYNRGEWLNVQVELDSSSSSTSADGGYKIWINNDSYSSPTAQRTGILLHSENWGYVWFGAFHNDGMPTNGVHAWQNTDFEVASAFSASWNTTGPRPRAPTAVTAN